MSSFHFKTLEVSGYRLFKAFKTTNLKRVNIVGGSNGIGKSSLLDAAFHLADRLNAGTLFRPFEWRGVPLGPSDYENATKSICCDQDDSNPIKISAATTSGEYSVEYKLGRVSISMAVVTPVATSDGKAATVDSYTSGSSTNGLGYEISSKHRDKVDFKAAVQFTPAGLYAQATLQNAAPMPKCMILNSTTRRAGPDAAERFSNATKQGRDELLIESIHLVHPKINKLQLLVSGGIALIYADLGDQKLVPISFLGDGAASLLNLALSFIEVQDGILFLDEFDTVVHHTLLAQMWELIFEMSKKFKVQVIATTHSDESLEAAAHAATRIKALDDLNYIRLRRNKSGHVEAVSYTGHALQSSLSENWEVR